MNASLTQNHSRLSRPALSITDITTNIIWSALLQFNYSTLSELYKKNLNIPAEQIQALLELHCLVLYWRDQLAQMLLQPVGDHTFYELHTPTDLPTVNDINNVDYLPSLISDPQFAYGCDLSLQEGMHADCSVVAAG